MFQESSNPAWRQPVSATTGYARAQQSFGSKIASDQYPCGYPATLKGTFERIAALKMLSLFPQQGTILDCPSGTGRVAELLLDRGFTVMASDVSAHMVERCRENMLERCPLHHERMDYRVDDITRLSFDDKSFDGAICNRLLHHYGERATRVLALSELARVSRSLVVASFTNSGSASIARTRVLKLLSGRSAPVRGLSCAQMAAEFDEAGLDVVATLPVMSGLSRMCYMAGKPKAKNQLAGAPQGYHVLKAAAL